MRLPADRNPDDDDMTSRLAAERMRHLLLLRLHLRAVILGTMSLLWRPMSRECGFFSYSIIEWENKMTSIKKADGVIEVETPNRRRTGGGAGRDAHVVVVLMSMFRRRAGES